MSTRAGSVLYVALGLLTLLGLLVMVGYDRMRDENLRIHRVYYSNAGLKLGEAAEAEAFAWLSSQLALPPGMQHPWLQRLYSRATEEIALVSGEEVDTSDPRYLDLLAEGLLPGTEFVAQSMPGGGAVQRATLAIADLEPLVAPPDDVLEPASQGRVVPDPFERRGTIQLVVEVDYGRVGPDSVNKRLVSRRDLKVVNTLLPVVSRFTLFVGGKRGSAAIEPHNQETLRPGWRDTSVGWSDLERNQPLILVHSPSDVQSRRGHAPSHGEIVRYRPFEPPFDSLSLPDPRLEASADYRPDLRDRGWVYLGGDQPWPLNTFSGIPNAVEFDEIYETSWATQLTGETFQIHETWRHSHGEALRAGLSPTTWNPDLGSSHGLLMRWTNSGYPSGFGGEVTHPGNLTLQPDFEPQSRSPSLLRLFGDIQPFHPSPGDLDIESYLDRRSPTLVLGAVRKRHHRSCRLSQLDLTERQAIEAGTFPLGPGGVDLLEDWPRGDRRRQKLIPYFHLLDGDRTYHADRGEYAFSSDWMGRSYGPILDDTLQGIPPDVAEDYARIRLDVRSEILRFDGPPDWRVLGLLMKRTLDEPIHRAVDWILANAHPEGFEPERTLKQEYLACLAPARGEVEDEHFFYGTSAPDQDLCYFASNLALYQFDPDVTPPESRLEQGAFPGGFFRGALHALRLFDPAISSAAFLEAGTPGTRGYDIRRKATFAFPDDDALRESFAIPTDPGHWRVSGISLVAVGDLDLAGDFEELVIEGSGIILVDGEITLPRVVRTEAARAVGDTVTFVSLRGGIHVAGDRVEASLATLDPGRTLTRSASDLLIQGNLVVGHLDFSPEVPGNLFSGRSDRVTEADRQPTGGAGLEGYPRVIVEYDPGLNLASGPRYRDKYQAVTSGGISYWELSE